MNRRKSRELAMKLLFESSINKKDAEEIIDDYKEQNEDYNDMDFEYIKTLLSGIQEKENILNEKIESSLTNWKLNRISKINMAILKVAVFEIFFVEEIPDKVSVNEAIELAKVYSDEKSPAFINGAIGNMINTKTL
ncbi:transcription antitermination factor NusB [Clostridium akagii]|uniref:transcription antitermination factor NusB n=1 Tax=Clostridium akagii TaxID=91623 RepID=UPI00047885C2|nr:transcription antitermination factor NusB [Clostridium akagii]